MSTSEILEEHPVGVRLKVSALWIAMLFLFAHGEIFGFFKPGRIASVMIFLTLVLRPSIARWANVVLPILYIASIVGAAFGESAYYWFLSVVESALLVLVIGYAWIWPMQEAPS